MNSLFESEKYKFFHVFYCFARGEAYAWYKMTQSYILRIFVVQGPDILNILFIISKCYRKFILKYLIITINIYNARVIIMHVDIAFDVKIRVGKIKLEITNPSSNYRA